MKKISILSKFNIVSIAIIVPILILVNIGVSIPDFISYLIELTIFLLPLLNILVLSFPIDPIKKRFIRNIQIALCLGLLYGFLSSANIIGIIISICICAGSVAIYSVLTSAIYNLCYFSNKRIFWYLYPLLFSAIIGFILIKSTHSIHWKTFYAIFHYTEEDPLGPGLATFYFSYLVPILYLFTGLLKAALKNNSEVQESY